MTRPRNVRNFWIELEVDGRTTKIQTGPAAKDGGFKMKIYQRDRGLVAEVLSVWGTVGGDSLDLEVWGPDGTIHVQTKR